MFDGSEDLIEVEVRVDILQPTGVGVVLAAERAQQNFDRVEGMGDEGENGLQRLTGGIFVLVVSMAAGTVGRAA